jgi:NADH-quinone oxidoreductase E subunit
LNETVETEDKLAGIIEKYRNQKNAVIGLLQDIQDAYRYLPEEVLQRVAAELDLPLSKLYSLATFYKSFRLDPLGKYHVCVCVGTACHVNGAAKLAETLERELKIKAGETSRDLKYTLETVNCLGACALGPLMVVNEEYHGKMDQKKLDKLLTKYKKEDSSGDANEPAES